MEPGGGASGEPPSLAQFLQKLKEVFDVCDEDADGFIRVEHFVALGLQFGQGEEVEKFAKYLDPNDLGKISFKDFCHGVFAIKGCEELLKDTLPAENLEPHHYETEYVDYYYQSSEIQDGGYLDSESAYSESDLFPDEENMTLAQQEVHHESDMDSAIESAHSSEASDVCSRNEEKDAGLSGLFLPGEKFSPLNPSAASDLSTYSTASLISNEEQFEDYGEGDDVDFTPSSPCPDDESRTNAYSDLGSSVSSSAGQTPRKMRHIYNSELLDVYCTQCCKKINLLNDLEARLKNLKANSPNRKISSTAFGRQLFHSSNFSSSNGSTEDLFRDSIDSCDNDITEKVTYLEKKVTELENDSMTNGDLKSKLKQENTQLVHRVHELEELLKDQETSAEQTLEEEIKRHREAHSKSEKEKSTEIELLNTRVQELEEENCELKTTVLRLKSQSEKLDEERQRMSDRLEDTNLRLRDEMDLYKRMMDKLRQNRLEFNKEREATQELIEDLRKELEHLQLYKLECERSGRGRSSSSSLSEFSARAREVEMEHEIKRLKQENQKLRDQNDDLNGQILSLSLYEAKNLFATQTKAQSLAAEIDSASRDELMEALKEQEEINYRLRQYMDKIILAILDHNPSILEIKN
ncbi:rab11 family-interacting protein 4 isoform X1 [Anolis carolinensis]|uniref:rab11 family-interacting protein 4 isoform X1 n=2 Tax=Anolis carolinensis TaxID=28377 RepID=UPI000462576B|nr:PREDICTED: rab11 family-interacting protein 4 [Anolis carolinensis]|eukprot:XP_008112587.1 PREDICTED: rab11 family-interacting protein 4 [Anolis carolinensis]